MDTHIGYYLIGADCYVSLSLDSEAGYHGVAYADPFDWPEYIRRWPFTGLKGILMELDDDREKAWMVVCGKLWEDPRWDLGVEPPSLIFIAAACGAERPADVEVVESLPEWCQDSLPVAVGEY